MANNYEVIKQALLDFGKPFDSAVLFPAVIPEAAPLVVSDPYAFSTATCLDRGTKADIIWTIPYDIQRLLGHLDPHRIYPLSLDKLVEPFARLPRRPRYVNDAPRTLKELTRIVVNDPEKPADTAISGSKESPLYILDRFICQTNRRQGFSYPVYSKTLTLYYDL